MPKVIKRRIVPGVKVKYSNNGDTSGKYDSKSNTISINKNLLAEEARRHNRGLGAHLKLVLKHELAHTTGDMVHGPVFQRTYEKITGGRNWRESFKTSGTIKKRK